MSAAPASVALPVVSVIIPCYNQAHFLGKALASVQQQSYPAVEIVLVDDGSTDNTRAVALAYEPALRYVYQDNQGLSAARNTGIRHSTGTYLVFLDADDWLYPQALALNVAHLQQHPHAAFVSGAFTRVFVDENRLQYEAKPIDADHYLHLLRGNYIGMIAAVLYQRWAFEEVLYDPTLRNCEDYDVYLRVARCHPVLHHTEFIAAYRLHTTNMSGNIPAMLEGILKVRATQKPLLASAREKAAYAYGDKFLRNFYCLELLIKANIKKQHLTATEIVTLRRGNKIFYLRYLKRHMKSTLRQKASKLKNKLLGRKINPAIGDIQFGDFDTLTPFSNSFAYDRGGPVDRYYIENFLQKESKYITGRVLEIGDNEYTMRFGKGQVTKSDILHVDATNTLATFIGDLCDAPQLPDAAFDCIILTQTLQLIYDCRAALATCARILKPNGVLLLTVPGITPLADVTWNEFWYWSFTNKAVRQLLHDTFPTAEKEVTSYGNVLAAGAFLYGVGLPELPKDKLDYHDPSYQLITAARVVKR
ncbi:glycosyltransferase [Hymenobacter sp. BT507]|uniref:Glycosyltransferase n=1 Tax=Hymenobacter citatus TaxID=2763506 RepID=A0ABR7MGQ5_9BACT|nr:glycosyltransferase [Hymenobacter citatus]MBC6610245.1 glycosyltransferase [Hymenobacter citatus]